MQVVEAVADALATESGGPIFGLVGDANLPVWSHLTRDRRARLVPTRLDASAVLMSEGYARVSGKVGIGMVTAGPGLASCANALLTAARSHTPIVLFAGEYGPEAPSPQRLDHERLAVACEAEYRSLNAPATLAQDIKAAFESSRERRGPVVLGLPHTLWNSELPGEWRYDASWEPPLPKLPTREEIAAILSEIERAERPLLLVGRGAAAARSELEEFAGLTGALIATTLMAKGMFDGHPFDLGVAGYFSSAPTERLIAGADLIVAVGTSLDPFTTADGRLVESARIVRIDVDPATPVPKKGIVARGDAGAVLQAATAELRGRSSRKIGYRTEAIIDLLSEARAPYASPTDGLDPRVLMESLSATLPDHCQVVIGAGHFWAWPVSYLSLPRRARFLHTNPFGSIGLGLAVGIGAAIAQPASATIVIEGDGGLLQSIQELHTAAELAIPLIVIVMNDAQFGAEALKMTWANIHPGTASWKSPDFVSIARGFGADGVLLESVSDFPAVMQRALAAKGPFLIDARISPTTVSDPYARLFLGAANRTPLLRPPTAGGQYP